MIQGQSLLAVCGLLVLCSASPPTSVSPQVAKSGASGSPAQGVSSSLAPSYRQAGPYGLSGYAVSPYYGHYAQQAQPQPSLLPGRFLALPARRRSSFTSKLRNFMNAIFFRQGGGKPAYSTDGFSYDPSVASKPYYLSPTSYKPVPVPVRQLQKYYKPYAAAESSYVPTYVSPYGGQASASNYGGAAAAALSGTGGAAASNGLFGTSGYAYPVQSSYNVGGYQVPSLGAAYKRSSTGPTTYTGPAPAGKVTFSKS